MGIITHCSKQRGTAPMIHEKSLLPPMQTPTVQEFYLTDVKNRSAYQDLQLFYLSSNIYLKIKFLPVQSFVQATAN